MDSTIRLRQLNQPELSGFIQSVIPWAQVLSLVSGDFIVPSGNGQIDLGAPNQMFSEVYSEGLYLPSGSGIWIGPNFFTAYTSGNNAVVQVGGYTITSNMQGLSILGPTGPTGPTGATGPSGATGIGITGIAVSGYTFRPLFTNGTTGAIVNVPTGASGATGTSVTGFYQSGSWILPLFSIGTTGAPISLGTGIQGNQGVPGGILIDCSTFTGVLSGQVPPVINIYNVNPYASANPDINLIKGMRYTIGVSGLNLSVYNSTGAYGIPSGTYQTNFFVDESGITGYLQFAVWSTSFVANTYTGRFVNPEVQQNNYSTFIANLKDSEIWYNFIEDPYKESISFNVRLSANAAYKYGFIRMSLNGAYNNTNTYGGYVLGNLYTNYFGPTGPSGAQGIQGIPGAQGQIGPAGGGGTPGVSVTGVITNINNQMAFLLSDGTQTAWVQLPLGGPTGPGGNQGIQGPTGPIGPTGATGPQGYADTYSASYFPSTISVTGCPVTSFNKEVSGTSSWVLCTGTGMYFAPGDNVWFQDASLVGKAYTTNQQMIFSDGNYTGGRYFYGTVNTFNRNNGEIQFVVSNTPYPPVGTSGGYVQWNQFNLINQNLGGLGSPGPTGPIGTTGPTGPQGNTGVPIFVISPLSGLFTNLTQTLTFGQYSSWNLFITGDRNGIDFDLTSFNTGQTILIKIKNSGSLTNNGPNPLIYWPASKVIFPYQMPAPGPNPGFTNVYTFVRFPDEAGTDRIFCTYSLNYAI